MLTVPPFRFLVLPLLMDLANRLSILRARAEKQCTALDRQKKMETALVLPFFDALGYDPFDVRDVEPEASVEREGEKDTVDYVLKKEARPVMLVEWMEVNEAPEVSEDHDLFRQAEALDASFVVFTNGLRYRLYAVSGEDARGSGKPILDFELLNHESGDVDVLRRFTKRAFDEDEILAATYDRTRSRQVREYLVQQTDTPDAPFVQFVAAQVSNDPVADDDLDQFRPVVQRVLNELLGAAEEEREPLSAPKDAPVPPNGETVADGAVNEQEQVGVFEKDIVKRVLEDF